MSDIYQFNVGGTTYNLANLGLLAPVQITLTADRLYNTGDQFIYTGLLYEATETIAQGTSITIGSNAQLADCVTKQISEINSNIATSVTEIDISTHLIGVSNKLRLFRFGKLRLLDYHGSKNLTIGTYTQIGSLSASDVPSYTITSIHSLGANSSTLAVYSNGAISVNSEKESRDYCSHLLVWFVN